MISRQELFYEQINLLIVEAKKLGFDRDNDLMIDLSSAKVRVLRMIDWGAKLENISGKESF